MAAIYLYSHQSRNDIMPMGDVIIVLGSGLEADNRPGPALYRRTAQGAKAWRRGLSEKIICSGGYGWQRERSEADACAELLIAQGVPAEAIIQEDRSRSTEENALYTQEIMQAEGWKSAVLVSDAYHLLRANTIFYQYGQERFAFYPSPAQDPPLLNHLSSLLREVAAFHWLLLKNLLNLPQTYVPII
jgi:uncharacterized SAM-binding protein YcdF (DUF218 family)